MMNMISNDFRIVINGQVFSVEGQVLKPVNENNFQQEVLKRLDGIESRLGSIESRLGTVEQGQRLLHVKVDDLQTSVYWVLAAIGIFLAALGIPAVIASILSAFRKSETKQPDSQSIASSIIEAFTKGLAAGRKEAQ